MPLRAADGPASVAPRDQGGSQARGGALLTAAPGAQLLDQPGGSVGLFDGLALGEQRTLAQRVTATSHRSKTEVGDDGIQPQPRPPSSPRPVARQLGTGRIAD